MLRIINDGSDIGNGQTATVTLGRDYEEKTLKSSLFLLLTMGQDLS